MKKLKRPLFALSLFLVSAGILVMLGMLIWSFHMDPDFTGRYETVAFHHQFWNCFFVGSGLFLLGCVGLGGTLESRMGIFSGLAALAAGFLVLVLLFLMPLVDYEGWTGAAAYTSVAVEFIGAAIILVLAGIRRLWQKLRPTTETN